LIHRSCGDALGFFRGKKAGRMNRARYASVFVVLLSGLLVEACGGGASSPGSGGSQGGSSGSFNVGGSAGSPGTGGIGGVGGATGGSGGTSGASGAAGTAGSGGTLCTEPDADHDNIPDSVEGAPNRDTDGDGIPDYLDTDSDNDGIPDMVEANTENGCTTPIDSDGDGIPNYIDTDSDNNGLPDKDEIYPDGKPYDPTKTGPGYIHGLADTDGDGVPDVYDTDNDGDGIPDTEELNNGKLVDTDGDGIPDLDDIDSDNDTIADVYETDADFDGDGIPNFRDLDSDGDGVPDACEAGFNHKVQDPPVDTDRDGKYDFIDLDSDNDGLKDGQEDRNGNCVVDVATSCNSDTDCPAGEKCDTTTHLCPDGETSRVLADTDGDGASDLIELNLDPDGVTNPAITPQSEGKYYFVMPYNQTPQPAKQDVVLKTNLNKGDIALVVDATGSMGAAIQNIQNNLSTIVSNVKAEVPDAYFGVLAQQDYPVSPYGQSPELPVQLPTPGSVLSGTESDTLAGVQALFTLDAAGGSLDIPEAQIPAMYRALNNTALNWQGGSVGPFSTPGGTGGLGFRSDALPIIVSVTDAPFHNGKYVNTTSLHDPYTAIPGAPTVDQLVASMNSAGAKFIGISLDNGGPGRVNGDPYRDMAYIADATNSLVAPSAFGAGSTHCLTDIGGNPVNPDGPGGLCRLIFSGYNSSSANAGTGVAATVENGIKALLSGIQLDVRVLASTQQPPYLTCGGHLVDAVNDFLTQGDGSSDIAANWNGGVADPSDPLGEVCVSVPQNSLRDWYQGPEGVIGGPPPPTNNEQPDSVNETFTGVTPGNRICFTITPNTNTICPQTNDVQIVQAELTVDARTEVNPDAPDPDEVPVGDPREVFFVIPPAPQ
jgi:Thrombospondin type 3 repeat